MEHVQSGLMGREVENIRSCDVVIFAGGRFGTLGEFSIAYDEAKVIGVLEGTGGISEHLKEIIGMMNKDTGGSGQL
jgi:predicted Rossmann-fold nucleotide-binding protein